MASTLHSLIPGTAVSGTAVSGVDVSARRGWEYGRPCSLALDVFPAVNGTGVSAGRCRT